MVYSLLSVYKARVYFKNIALGYFRNKFCPVVQKKRFLNDARPSIAKRPDEIASWVYLQADLKSDLKSLSKLSLRKDPKGYLVWATFESRNKTQATLFYKVIFCRIHSLSPKKLHLP